MSNESKVLNGEPGSDLIFNDGHLHELKISIEAVRDKLHAVALDDNRASYLDAEEQLFHMESRFGRDVLVRSLNEMPDYDLSCAANLVDFSLGDALPELLSLEKLTAMLASAQENDLRVGHLLQSVFLTKGFPDAADYCMDLMYRVIGDDSAMETLLGLLWQLPFRSENELCAKLAKWDETSMFDEAETALNDLGAVGFYILSVVFREDVPLFEKLLERLLDPLTGRKIQKTAAVETTRRRVPKHPRTSDNGEGDWL